MRQFYAPIEDIIKSAKSQLSADVPAGSTNIPLKNTTGMTVNKYIVLGRIGDETSELKKISNITDDNKIVVDSATLFPHYLDGAVTQLDYNKRKLYSRATSDDSWVEVSASSPKEIIVDSPLGTLFEDISGTPTTQYISTYYNEALVIETDKDDAVIVYGTESSVNLCTIQQIRVAAGWQDNYYVSDSRIDEARQQAQGEVWATLRNKYTFPLTRNSKFLERIVIDMAVGFLFIDEYGLDVQNVAKDGYKRLEDARIKLNQLAEGVYVLYDEEEGSDQALSSRGTVGFYPDDNTENDDERIFSIGMKF